MVYAAEWGPAQIPVALKVYSKLGMFANRRKAIRREARMMRMAALIGVPHIVKLYGVVEDAETIAIVMELCESAFSVHDQWPVNEM